MLERAMNLARTAITLVKHENPNLKILRFEILLDSQEITTDQLVVDFMESLDTEFFRGWVAAEKEFARHGFKLPKENQEIELPASGQDRPDDSSRSQENIKEG